jgi:hypothetical protein
VKLVLDLIGERESRVSCENRNPDSYDSGSPPEFTPYLIRGGDDVWFPAGVYPVLCYGEGMTTFLNIFFSIFKELKCCKKKMSFINQSIII